jgi:undecaprenyl-diphosphatase
MLRLDIDIFNFINQRLANPILDRVMPYVTMMGGGEFLFVLAIAFVLFINKKMRLAGILLFAGLTLSYYSSAVLKDMIARPRPFAVLEGVRVLTDAHGYSCPSTHATQAFMAAMVLSGIFGWAGIFLAIAALVGFSRVYLGVHYISDAVSGALLGCAIGFMLIKLSRGFIPDDDA